MVRVRSARWDRQGGAGNCDLSMVQKFVENMANAKGIKRERSEEEFHDGNQRQDRTSSASPSHKRGKFERSFVPSWLDRFDWLVFDNQRNLMFCDLCKKFRKNNAFTEGCQNFRRDNLNKHMLTNDHKYCVEQEGLKSSGTSECRVLESGHGRANSPATSGRHSSTDSSRSSGIFSSASSSLPQSPVSMTLPSPPSFTPSRTPSSTIHAPVPLLPLPPMFPPYACMDPRFSYGMDL